VKTHYIAPLLVEETTDQSKNTTLDNIDMIQIGFWWQMELCSIGWTSENKSTHLSAKRRSVTVTDVNTDLKILLWNLKHVTASWNASSRTQAFIYPPIITLLRDCWIDHFAGMRATENYAVM